ncbi:YcxB family protein [bacterium]|nr:YcxB family protein [bacterium]
MSEGADAIEVSYSLKEEDVDAYRRYYAIRRPAILFDIGFKTLTVVLAISSIYTLAWPPTLLADIFPLALALMPVVAVFPLMIWSRFGRAFRAAWRSTGQYGEQRMRISPDGIFVSGPTGETLKYWKAVHRIVESGGHAFIFTGHLQAFILPRRAFASSEAREAFLARARAWQASARAVPAPSSTMTR